MPFKSRSYPEVDFTSFKDVQLTYKQNIYNIQVQYSRSVLDVVFVENNTSYDGISYKLTPESCQVSFSGLVHSFDVNELPENYLPVIILGLFSDTGSQITTENYDSENDCYYISRAVNSSFVKLQIYENESNISYTLIIT